MTNGLKVFYNNIEAGIHLERSLPKIKAKQPEVAAFLEVRDDHVELLEKSLSMKGYFHPAVKEVTITYLGIPPKVKEGSLILVAPELEVLDWGVRKYSAGVDDLPTHRGNPKNVARFVHWAKIKKGSTVYNLLLTHFTWSPNGLVTAEQRADLKRMLVVISDLEREKDLSTGFVFMGDLNSPRVEEGLPKPFTPSTQEELTGDIWESLAKLYQDNIPQNVYSTIDQNLHRVPKLMLCVDFCFTHKKHGISEAGVEVMDSVSDHKGLCFEVCLN